MQNDNHEPVLESELDKNNPSTEAQENEVRKPTLRRKILLGVGIFIFVILLTSLASYNRAISDRISYGQEISSTLAADQFQLGLQQREAGNYELARMHFEEVIRLDPTYPGAIDQLQTVLVALNTTATPTLAPTIAATPTLDNRSEEDLLVQAHNYRDAEDWDNLILTLDSLRFTNQSFHAVEVDSLYYVAYLNRGVERILAGGNLEGGIFDLNTAERFAPIGQQASSYRQWAEWYITGASFWEVDWAQAVYFFSQVANLAPNIHDSEYFYAQDRLSTAQVGYADELIEHGLFLMRNFNFCDASRDFQQAFAYVTPDPLFVPTAVYAENYCANFQQTPTP